MKKSVIKALILSASLTLLVTGCVKTVATDTVSMKVGPPPEILAEGGEAKRLPAGFIKRRLRLGYPSLENIVINDRSYLYITERWFRDIMDWTEDFIHTQVPEIGGGRGYPLGYEGTFALLASNSANISVARRYRLNASVLIGVMTAVSKHPWGTIQADGELRAYVIGLTEGNGVVYDVRTKQVVEFNDFPNIESMKGILF